jgi:tetratricopeptide (TPR) repeat protein
VALVPGLEGLQEQLFNIAKDVEVVHQTTERTETKVDALLAQVAREKGVPVAPLLAVLAQLGEKGVADEDIPKKLSNAVDELIKLRVENDSLKKGPPEIAAIATETQTLIDKGEFDAARAVLARGRQAWKKSRESSSRYEAQLLAQEAGIVHLQLAYRSAAAKYAEAASLVASFDAEGRKKWLLAEASELYDQGNEFGDNSALVEAISFYRQCLALTSRESAPLQWAMTHMNLGVALETLGERESGTGKLEEAVAAYREALKEWTRERVPLQWATTQMNLGVALETLGERESGTGKLEEAVAAYREALKEWTRERVPLDWARTQMNLGTALETLGERESGTGKLEEAVAAS